MRGQRLRAADSELAGAAQPAAAHQRCRLRRASPHPALPRDFDGRIDSPSDPGCANAADPNERSTKQCDVGLDDDGDGLIDWRGDGTGAPHCVSLGDNNESPPPSPSWGCGIGLELLLLGPLLAAARRRPSSAAPRSRREPLHQD